MAESKSVSALRDTWDAAAPGWAKWEQAFFDRAFADATETMMDMAGVDPGMRVLDLACGAGSQSIQAARRVGPEGSVVACDISATMLEHVRRNAADAGVQNLETHESAAEDLRLPAESFDASICRMGLMLFPSPAEALRAVREALRPGARFAALVFTTPAGNPALAQPMAILLRHAGKAPPGPGQPGLFALGAEGVLARMLADSGFEDVRVEAVRVPFTLPSAGDFLALLQEAAGAYRAVVADLGDAERARAWEDVQACVEEFEAGADGGFASEFEVLIGSCARPN